MQTWAQFWCRPLLLFPFPVPAQSLPEGAEPCPPSYSVSLSAPVPSKQASYAAVLGHWCRILELANQDIWLSLFSRSHLSPPFFRFSFCSPCHSVCPVFLPCRAKDLFSWSLLKRLVEFGHNFETGWGKPDAPCSCTEPQAQPVFCMLTEGSNHEWSQPGPNSFSVSGSPSPTCGLA